MLDTIKATSSLRRVHARSLREPLQRPSPFLLKSPRFRHHESCLCTLGAYYFTLASESPNQGTVTVFVSDEKGVTYKLILVPRPVAGEEIIIRPPSEKATPSSRAAADGRTVSYQRRIKDLMLVMADDELKDSVETIPVNKEVPLWKEGRLILVAKYMDGEVVGEKYRLTNVSPSEMLLVEQELYRRGVRAIAVEHHTLMQGDGTDIYIVRERKDNE